jgi:hypothetical protein
MPARGSGIDRKAMAVLTTGSLGARGERNVSEETRKRISVALHAYHGSDPDETPAQRRKRKYVPHPRTPAPRPAEKGTRRASTTKKDNTVRSARARSVKAVQAKAGVSAVRRLAGGRGAHLISGHTRRRLLGYVHTKQRTHRSKIKLISSRHRGHRVWVANPRRRRRRRTL